MKKIFAYKQILIRLFCFIIMTVWFVSLLPGLSLTIEGITERYYLYGNKTAAERESFVEQSNIDVPMHREVQRIIKEQIDGNI